MMNIANLKTGQSNVNVEGVVSDVGEIRSFSKFGRAIKVATATLKDETGDIKLSLWNEDADRIKKGDKIKISNGFIKEFQGEKQITAGKFGKIEVIGKGEAGEEEEEEMPEEKIEGGEVTEETEVVEEEEEAMPEEEEF